jgi:hypothetical protein
VNRCIKHKIKNIYCDPGDSVPKRTWPFVAALSALGASVRELRSGSDARMTGKA